MIVGEFCFAHLLQQCVRPLSEPTHKRDNDRFDDLTRGIVLIAAENGETLLNSEVIGERFKEIGRVFDLKANDDWLLYERIPFDAAAALIEGCLQRFLDDSDFISLLRHPLSGIRLFCCRLAWVMKDNLERDDVVPILLSNVADKLGYVELSAGLARSFFEKPSEFFDVASAYTPADGRFEEQYRDRIANLKDEYLIESILLDLVSEEAKLRKQISQQLFALSLPSAETRTPRQLEIPLGQSVKGTSEPTVMQSDDESIACFCEHVKAAATWPALRSCLVLHMSSKLDYGIASCRDCGKRCLTCLWGMVNSKDGKYQVWNTMMPLSEVEVTELESLYREGRETKDYLIRVGGYFENDREKLVLFPDGSIVHARLAPMQAATLMDRQG